MNPLKKIYCRIFQNVFKFALPFLPYRNPEIISSLKAVPDVLKKKKCKNVLIITDAGIHKLGLTDRLEKVLTDSSIPYILYDKTVANPTTVNVAEALELYHENNCQAIIGFGGGSSMDCAKAVGARVAKPHQSLAKMKGILKVRKKLPLLIAVPTTAGTGSETTLAAYRGISGKSLMAYLCRVSASTITAASVVSLPVPAVVGTAIRSGSFLCTFRIPFIFARD